LIDTTCKLAANSLLHRLLCLVLTQQSATGSSELVITAQRRLHSTGQQNKHTNTQLVFGAA